MAIEYDLEFATRLSVDEVAMQLAEVGWENGILDASVTGARLVTEGAETGLGTWIRVIEPKPPQPWNAMVRGLVLLAEPESHVDRRDDSEVVGGTSSSRKSGSCAEAES
ncbi:hypothetical protein [Streptomyces sp. NPDC001435]|uniref:hypothetical protein n=1 Tax=Streptomyces sp. NPDC001435 TaxID=3364576 RepID=UPI0036BE94EC